MAEKEVSSVVQENDPNIIKIEGKSFKISEMSDSTKGAIASFQKTETELKTIDDEILRLRQLKSIIQTARNSYSNAIRDELGLPQSN